MHMLVQLLFKWSYAFYSCSPITHLCCDMVPLSCKFGGACLHMRSAIIKGLYALDTRVCVIQLWVLILMSLYPAGA